MVVASMWPSCTVLFLAFVRNLNLPYTQVDETNSLARRVCTSHVEREQTLQNCHSNNATAYILGQK